MNTLESQLAAIDQKHAQAAEAEKKNLIQNQLESLRRERDEKISDLQAIEEVLKKFDSSFQPLVKDAPIVPNRVYATKNATDAVMMILLDENCGVGIDNCCEIQDIAEAVVSDSLKQGWTYKSVQSIIARMSQEFCYQYSVRGKNEVTKDYLLRRTSSGNKYLYYVIKAP